MSWGNFLNSATGANAAAKTQYKYQQKLQDDAQNFAKWQMGNAHQMEVQDLEKAGLNKILSAGGSGASAGVSASSVSAPSGGLDPLTLMSTALNAYSTIQQTKNNTAKTNADITNETEMTKANVAKALAEAGAKQNEINYYLEHGVFPGATNTVSVSGGGLGFNHSNSITTPVGLKGPKGNTAKDLNNRKLPKPPKAMSGNQYRKWLKKQGYKVN